MKNLWLLTEERPKSDVVGVILNKFASDRKLKIEFQTKISFVPVFDNKKFTFTYQIQGASCQDIQNIYLKIVSGRSSFVDYMIFYQEQEPNQKDIPVYLIEETKTDDKESRNTGVYQRCSKFVYANFYFPEVPKIMLYSLKIKQKDSPTSTNIFGTKMLLTLGVEIIGKKLDPNIFKPFKSINELINEKKLMRKPPKGNVPVDITQFNNKIEISAKLIKADRLSHDPNIGMTTIIASCLRQLGFQGEIIITRHGLPNQQSIGKNNKFVSIANQINIKLEGLDLPSSTLPDGYWKIEDDCEKLGTIFTSIICEEFASGIPIYENHGGCERGYFISQEGEACVVPKYSDRAKYKAGDKTSIVYIPDVVIFDKKRNIIVNCEGKTYRNMEQGISDLENFDSFENTFIKKYYPKSSIQRTVILYGGSSNSINRKEIGLLLNQQGSVILGDHSPEIFKEAYSNLLNK